MPSPHLAVTFARHVQRVMNGAQVLQTSSGERLYVLAESDVSRMKSYAIAVESDLEKVPEPPEVPSGG